MSPTSQTPAAYQNFLRQNYCNVSVRALFLWDYCVTFGDEVRWVWTRRVTPATILFLANRYVNLLITVFEFLEQAAFQNSKSCGSFVRLIQSLLIAALFIVAAFNALRIYALWDQDWRPAAPVLILSLVAPVLNIIMDSYEGTRIAPPPSTGCAISLERLPGPIYSKFIIASRASTTAADGLIFLLTLLRTVRLGSPTSILPSMSALTEMLVKDGTVCFLALFTLNVVQIIVTARVPGNNYVSFYVTPVTSLLLSRFLINLRRVSERHDITSSSPVCLTSDLHTAVPSDSTGALTFPRLQWEGEKHYIGRSGQCSTLLTEEAYQPSGCGSNGALVGHV